MGTTFSLTEILSTNSRITKHQAMAECIASRLEVFQGRRASAVAFIRSKPPGLLSRPSPTELLHKEPTTQANNPAAA